MKYIVITGGVMSGIGKGVTASSVGVILKSYGLSLTAIKIDPYLNQDAGTMSPFEHGECYVLKDGGEVDLDLGNYERFMNITLTRDHNITMGKIYKNVLDRERAGDYLGKTVQIIPHICDAIIEWISRTSVKLVDNEQAREPDICIIELGGTIGDIESMPFVEALRQFSYQLGSNNVMFIHVSYVPVLRTSDEEKTKPTQHSIQTLRSLGIQPDILCIRCEKELTKSGFQKLSNYCQVKNIISVIDVSNIYRIPLLFDKCNLISNIIDKLKINLGPKSNVMTDWEIFANNLDRKLNRKIISIVGKYTGLHDSYLSLTHCIRHAALHLGIYPEIKFIDSELIETGSKDIWNTILKSDALIIPGGFGVRGVWGMIDTIKYARENNVPILGICYGMQLMVIELSRHICGLSNAQSEEFEIPNCINVIIKMDELNEQMGGTMRLGLRKTVLEPNTYIQQIYSGQNEIYERHRHRYEVNPEYTHILEENQVKFSGKCEQSIRMSILELNNHPFFIGCQFHPEFQTYPYKPHPILTEFLIKTTISVEKLKT